VEGALVRRTIFALTVPGHHDGPPQRGRTEDDNASEQQPKAERNAEMQPQQSDGAKLPGFKQVWRGDSRAPRRCAASLQMMPGLHPKKAPCLAEDQCPAQSRP
jgi:hypothetical protein